MNQRLRVLALAIVAAANSGCALIQSGSTVKVNPTNPKEEFVTTKKCTPNAYPFEITVGLFSDQYSHCIHGNDKSDPPTLPQSRGWCIGEALAISPVAIPVGLVGDAIGLIIEIPLLFTSDCKDAGTITRANPNYRDTSGRPANISLAGLQFKDPGGEGVLRGVDGGAIDFVLRNDQSAGRAVDIEATITASPETGLRFNKIVKLGDLSGGEPKSVEIPIEATDAVPDGETTFAITFKEAGRNPPDPARVKIKTQRFRAPRFTVSHIALDDGSANHERLAFGNGDGIWEPGEAVELHVDVANEGAGNAGNVAVSIAGDDDKDLRVLEDAHFKRTYDVGKLNAHETKQLVFALTLSRMYAGKADLPLAITISERRERFNTTIPLGVKIGKRMAQPQNLDVAPADMGVGAPLQESVDVPPLTHTPMNPDALAVVIGIEKYRQKGIPNVDFAALDAQTVYSYLTRAMGYDPKNVVLLTNEQATKGDLEKYLGAWLKNRTTERSKVFVYYAGHGTPNPQTGEAYLVPYEGDPAYTVDTAYPVKRLYKTLARLPSKDITVALDACFSGAGGRSIVAQGARPLVTVRVDSEGLGKNTVVLAASGADQISSSYPQGQHGLLTYFLLKGIHGAADSKHDGSISTDELFDYLKPEVERQARLQNVEQTPTITPEIKSLGNRAGEPWVILNPKS